MRHFPAANPVSLERSNFKVLQDNEFMCGLKTDGVRHMLLLTLKPNSALPIAIMVDRAKTMYEVEVWAHEDYFCKGTLMDGELVWDNSNRDNMIYVAFDIILSRGSYCLQMLYKERLELLHGIVLCVDQQRNDESVETQVLEEEKLIARNNDYNIQIIPKRCVFKSQLPLLWSQRHHETHNNDGIIFTMNCSGVDTGTSKYVFKWKNEHTIDIKASLDPKTFSWIIHVNSNADETTVDINSIGASREFVMQHNKLLDALCNRQPCIVECVLSIDKESGAAILIPERQRTDKCTSNNVRTILATLRNVEESISAQEVFDTIV